MIFHSLLYVYQRVTSLISPFRCANLGRIPGFFHHRIPGCPPWCLRPWWRHWRLRIKLLVVRYASWVVMWSNNIIMVFYYDHSYSYINITILLYILLWLFSLLSSVLLFYIIIIIPYCMYHHVFIIRIDRIPCPISIQLDIDLGMRWFLKRIPWAFHGSFSSFLGDLEDPGGPMGTRRGPDFRWFFFSPQAAAGNRFLAGWEMIQLD